jgi:peptidoglycan DL-endopeptidase CwlO
MWFRNGFRALLTLAIVLAPAIPNTPAAGQTSSSKEKEARKLQDQLDALDEQGSILAEEANQASVRLTQAKAELRKANVATEESTATFVVAQAAAKSDVIRRYVEGPATRISLNDSLQTASIKRAYRDVATGQNIDRIDELSKATQDLNIAKAKAARTAKRISAEQSGIERAMKRNDAVSRKQEALLKRTKADVVKLLALEESRRIQAEAKAARALVAKQKATALKVLQQREGARKKAAEKAAQAAAKATPGKKPQIRQLPPPTPDQGGDQGDQSDAAVAAAADVPSNVPSAQGASRAVAVAMAQIGKPYVWGAAGESSFDCSGLMGFAWSAAGHSLPHSSRAQYSATRRVSRSELQPGDLLFFGSPIHHVGMYIGDGQMVEAPHSRALVRVRPYLRRDYVGAGRVG